MPEKYIAVPTLVKALFRPVENADAPQLCTGNPGLSLNQAARDEAQLQGRLPDAVIQILSRLEKKLDTVISLLNKDGFERDFPHKAWITELSASNFTMECVEALAPGDYLEVAMMLEEVPLTLASGIVRVEARLPGKPAVNPANSVFSLSFVNIREEEREMVIKHVFHEERKRIRQQKGDQ